MWERGKNKTSAEVFNPRNRSRFGLTTFVSKADSHTYSDESFFSICGSLPGSTTTSELRFLTTKPCSWHSSFYTSPLAAWGYGFWRHSWHWLFCKSMKSGLWSNLPLSLRSSWNSVRRQSSSGKEGSPNVRRIASLKFGEFGEFSYIPQKFRYILEELTDSSQLTQKCIFGEFGEFCIFCIFGRIRATFSSIPLWTLFIFSKVPLVEVVANILFAWSTIPRTCTISSTSVRQIFTSKRFGYYYWVVRLSQRDVPPCDIPHKYRASQGSSTYASRIMTDRDDLSHQQTHLVQLDEVWIMILFELDMFSISNKLLLPNLPCEILLKLIAISIAYDQPTLNMEIYRSTI